MSRWTGYADGSKVTCHFGNVTLKCNVPILKEHQSIELCEGLRTRRVNCADYCFTLLTSQPFQKSYHGVSFETI